MIFHERAENTLSLRRLSFHEMGENTTYYKYTRNIPNVTTSKNTIDGRINHKWKISFYSNHLSFDP